MTLRPFPEPGLFSKERGGEVDHQSVLFCSKAGVDGDVETSIRPVAMCNLASGSAGNATILRFGEHTILLDAGIGPRTSAKRLRQTGVAVEDISAIFLTHLDSDHFRPTWINKLLALRIPVLVHQRHLPHLRRVPGGGDLEAAGLIGFFDGQPFEIIAGVKVSTIALPHDSKGSTGYRFDTEAGSVGYVTDLGRVGDKCVEFLSDVDILAIESNYDYEMQIRSPRPPFLKDRIMNGRGHLCNDEAYQAVSKIMLNSQKVQPKHIVLLHPSRQCNSHGRIRKVFEKDQEIYSRLVLTEQGSRTEWIVVRR